MGLRALGVPAEIEEIDDTLSKNLVNPRTTARRTTAQKMKSKNDPWKGNGWRTLTPPQPLPAPEWTSKVEVNGANLHYAVYGSENAETVLLLHGGLGAAEDFGGQIDALAAKYKVIAIDSRGHGESTDDGRPYGYELMASDVMGVMDSVGADKAGVVGWSDGANIGLELAINNPTRLTRVFALGANYHISGVRASAADDALIHAYVEHAAAQYARISPTPDAWEAFSRKVFAMWGSEPGYTEQQLAEITVPFMIAAGVYEEAIDLRHTERMAELIPGAQLLLIDNASHFAHWQQVEAVNNAILEFLGGK